MLLIY